MIFFCVCNVLEFFVTANMICIYMKKRVWFNSCVAAFFEGPDCTGAWKILRGTCKHANRKVTRKKRERERKKNSSN